MTQGVVQDNVSAALVGALRLAQQRGRLKVEPMPAVSLESSKRPQWGDVSSTEAMCLSASERRLPYEIAQIIIDYLEQREASFRPVEIARPGFLTLTVKQQLWMEGRYEIEAQGAAYGQTQAGQGAGSWWNMPARIPLARRTSGMGVGLLQGKRRFVC